MTLTFEIDLAGQREPQCQISTMKVIYSESYHLYTQTYIEPTALHRR